ncbi:unnamed protein product [Hermetia illucens]|uniref:Hcy-binding domain-containing protein n=1 Tax=Hermetia illucens TaxID=343691 RepID=A0A7R8UF70_HERIL|nr:homocysteine S-methyltransferase 2-like [Hermetia illucens]XP_037926853.1 homocysteine S-methyltransferase 2-like [Hermetia illucens]XP_037926854.1 homocysteine S-methyltransferase 2-like [Hermetia illucens]XP_037926855.1 homocysteine S-methyltransferase 2-like [Hermetia illucens]CAD7079598.1 unnamed protein product [Hermetia illucens]
MKKDILIKSTCEATQLRVYVKDQIDGDPLWCARFNATNPEAVAQIHLDFLEAGADIIVTNTYQASVAGYMQHLGLSREESIDLIKKTVKLARDAREKFLAKTRLAVNKKGLPLIAASIGPYGAHLHDGSDYSGDYAEKVKPEVIKEWHKTHIDAVLEAGVDALAFETVPCQAEAKALADLLCDDYPHVKFWLSLQCKDGSSLANGDSFAETCSLLWDQFTSHNITENCLGIGTNCLNPKYVTSLLESVNGKRPENQRIPIVVYPNSGETYDKNEGWLQEGNRPTLDDYVPKWIELGVKVLGGCCRTSIHDIPKYREIISNLT